MKTLYTLVSILFATSLYAGEIHMRCDVNVKVTHPDGSFLENFEKKDVATITISQDKEGLTVSGSTSVENTNLSLFATTIQGGIHKKINLTTTSNITIFMTPINTEMGYSDVRLDVNRINGEIDYSDFSRAKSIKIKGRCKIVNKLF